MTKKSINSGSRKWVIVALMFLAAFLFSCEKKESVIIKYHRYNDFGFSIGDSVHYNQSLIDGYNVFGSPHYRNKTSCVFSHCTTRDVSLDGLTGHVRDLSKYSKDKALNDTLWIWSNIELSDNSYELFHETVMEDTESVTYLVFPAYPLNYISFKVCLNDVIDGEEVFLSPEDVYLRIDTYYAIKMLSEESRRRSSNKRLEIKQFGVKFTKVDLDSLLFNGVFSMDWTIDCKSDDIYLHTDSGFFIIDMKLPVWPTKYE